MPDGRVLYLGGDALLTPSLDEGPLDVEAERTLMQMTGVASWPVMVIDAVASAPEVVPESTWAAAIEVAASVERAADLHEEIGLATGIGWSRFNARGLPGWVLWSLLQRHPGLGWS